MEQGERGMSISVGRSGTGGASANGTDSVRFRAFAIAVLVTTVLLLFYGRIAAEDQGTQVWDLLGWVGLVAITGLVPLGKGRGPRLAMDLPLLLAAAFVFDPAAAGLVAFAGAADIREFRREISVTRSLWNRAQTALSVMAASATFGAVGELGDWPGTAGAAVLALLADAVVNYAVVAYGTSLRTGRGVRATLTEMRIGSARTFIITYACFGFVGVLTAEAYAALGFLGVVASIAPVVLGAMTFFHRFKLESLESRLIARSTALRRVDQRIAEERRDERSRIAEALHDEVLQDLYNISIRAQVLRQDLLSGRLLDLENDLPAVIRATEVAVEDLRGVIQGLRQATIGHAGLVETLNLFIKHIASESAAKLALSVDEDVHTTPERELVVYQVAREALINASRHAAARTIWVTLRREDDGGRVQLVVEDDGCGFDQESPLPSRHFGLELMKQRADSIAASLSVSSQPGSGTVVRLVFDLA